MPASAWKGVLVADHLGSVCLQGSVTAPLGGEDCLYLNICKLAGASAGSRLPAILWVHGGGYNGGSGGVFDGSALAKRENIVVITINYRLRALGFLAQPDLGDGGKGWCRHGDVSGLHG